MVCLPSGKNKLCALKKKCKHFDVFSPDWGMLRRSRCAQIFL